MLVKMRTLLQEFDQPVTKMMIASTPKSGNTWVKLILSRVYQLPVIIPPAEFDEKSWGDFGEKWITHQHLRPNDEIIHWFNQNKIPVITTIRHPGDVLVSLFHYTKWAKTNRHLTALASDQDEMGLNTMHFITSYRFAGLLELSINWLQQGSFLLRYEDMLQNPIVSIEKLCKKIAPVSMEQIKAAVASCEFSVLKRTNDKRHFRSGSSGQWQEEIPKPILDVLQNDSRYQKIFDTLGYSLDEKSGEPAIQYFDYSGINPFYNVETFTNGIRISGIIIQYYFSSPEFQKRWPHPERVVGSDSFYHWLMCEDDTSSPTDFETCSVETKTLQDCDQENSSDSDTSKINNIAAYIYKIRPDIQRVFPDYRGKDKKAYLKWYQKHGQREYALDKVFCEQEVSQKT